MNNFKTALFFTVLVLIFSFSAANAQTFAANLNGIVYTSVMTPRLSATPLPPQLPAMLLN